MLESLPDVLSASPWTYGVILAVAALDVLVPVVPSETTVLAAGILAGAGDLEFALVVGAAAVGAFVGDNVAYAVGRVLEPRVSRAVHRRPTAGRRREWAERKLRAGGATLLVGARFVPGGRTAVTLTAGLVRIPWRRYLALSAFAAAAWALCVAGLGYAGGRVFEERPYLLVPVGIALAGALPAAAHLLRRKHRGQSTGEPRHATGDATDSIAEARPESDHMTSTLDFRFLLLGLAAGVALVKRGRAAR